MIRHTVLFRFKPDFPDEQREAWTAGLDRLRGGVPGLLSLTHGPNVVASARAFDYAIVADFASVEDIAVYDTHPLHEPLKQFSFPHSEQILAVDFEIPQDAS